MPIKALPAPSIKPPISKPIEAPANGHDIQGSHACHPKLPSLCRSMRRPSRCLPADLPSSGKGSPGPSPCPPKLRAPFQGGPGPTSHPMKPISMPMGSRSELTPSEAHSFMPTVTAPMSESSPSKSPSVRSTAEEWSPQPPVSNKEELHRFIARSTQKFNHSSTLEEFIGKCHDPLGDIHPGVTDLHHRAAHMSDRLRVLGATVGTKAAPWTLQQTLNALSRGSHQSATQYVEFLRGEFADMIWKGQWVLLPAKLLLSESNLILIPLGCHQVDPVFYRAPVLDSAPSICVGNGTQI
jgi:hypothetical protein